MNVEVRSPLIVAAVYLWIGFVCAISFMEAWLKFRAPGVDLSTGLSIGRLVFNALNKVEWVFAIAILLNLFLGKELSLTGGQLWFYLPFMLLIVQTFWLLPALDIRAEQRMRGLDVPGSGVHVYYVVMEVVKVSSLIFFSFRLFK